MKFLLTIFTSCALFLAHSQTRVTGKVFDEKDEEISFAHVYNKSNDLGKVSDMLGRFDITASKGDTIEFSFVGYQTLNLVVNSIHLATYLKITLTEDSVLLPSITIFSDPYYKVPFRVNGIPIRIEGVTIDEDIVPIRVGQISFGTSPSQPGGIPNGGVGINGLITYFSRDEREKRKAVEAQEETNQTLTYQKFVATDSVRNQLMYIYSLDSSQYARIIVRLNHRYHGVQKATTGEEIWHWIIDFFDEQVPIIKVWDMTNKPQNVRKNP